MIYFLIPFAFLPSIIWLLFYLRKDAHPESKLMVLKIFLFGMLMAVPAVFIGFGFFDITSKLPIDEFLILLLNVFIGVALVEEVLKYVVVRYKVLSHSEFDEPVDVMIYMIVAALGFAALENIFYLLQSEGIFEAFLINFFRFVGAVFLHALLSGMLGYFLALSLYKPKKKLKLLIWGFFLVTFLHGLFNYVIKLMVGVEEWGKIVLLITILVVILIGSALFVSHGFKRLKKIKSICKIN